MTTKISLILIFICSINKLSSQILKVEGPTEVLQYSTVIYEITLNYIRKSCAYYPQQPYGYHYFGSKAKKLGENLYEYSDTLFFINEGLHSTFNNYLVTVKPNPVKLDIPPHVCPYGTQLMTNDISPDIEKRFTIFDEYNTNAKISETGILTYNPLTSGTIKVKYELYFRNQNCYKGIEKYIYLNNHDLLGSLYQLDKKENEVRRDIFQHWSQIDFNLETYIEFDYPIEKLSWNTFNSSSLKNIF